MSNRRLFLDIETQANPETIALMPEPKAPGNLKDPAKIEAAIAEKKAEWIETAALDPDYGRILSIGTFVEDKIAVYINGEIYPEFVPDESDEAETVVYKASETRILEAFWEDFRWCDCRCVGFNILSFDLPYLLRRSMALGIKVPFLPSLAKYRVEPVTDLFGILYNWDWQRAKGLKQIAKLYGIPNDCPDVDGSKVKDLDVEALCAYQASDVKLTIALYQKMNGVYFNL
jgi:DNA polymerase elongation subunit (family B)